MALNEAASSEIVYFYYYYKHILKSHQYYVCTIAGVAERIFLAEK